MLDHLKKQFEYDLWANTLMIDALINHQISDEKSLKWINHIVNAEIIWMDRIQGIPMSVPPFSDRTLEDCKVEMMGTAQRIRIYLDSATEDDISQILNYSNTKGDSFQNIIKDILAHLVNHSTHHRAQIAARVRELGIAPPQTDYIFYLR